MGSWIKEEAGRSHPLGIFKKQFGGDAPSTSQAKRNPMTSNAEWDAELRRRGVYVKPATSILSGDSEDDAASIGLRSSGTST
jgi:hypothetical protein